MLSNAEKIREYKKLQEEGIITQEEFETKKEELLLITTDNQLPKVEEGIPVATMYNQTIKEQMPKKHNRSLVIVLFVIVVIIAIGMIASMSDENQVALYDDLEFGMTQEEIVQNQGLDLVKYLIRMV